MKEMRRTANPVQAARSAGYAHPEQEAWRLMRTPEVVARVQAEVTALLKTDGARIGVQTLIEIAGDPKYPAGARVMAGRDLVKLSGVGVDVPDDEKSPDQMSRAELEAAARSIRSKLADLDNVIDVEPAPKTSVFD
ncbi:hypothetical protein [Methylorubrum zatmanii]